MKLDLLKAIAASHLFAITSCVEGLEFEVGCNSPKWRQHGTILRAACCLHSAVFTVHSWKGRSRRAGPTFPWWEKQHHCSISISTNHCANFKCFIYQKSSANLQEKFLWCECAAHNPCLGAVVGDADFPNGKCSYRFEGVRTEQQLQEVTH